MDRRDRRRAKSRGQRGGSQRVTLAERPESRRRRGDPAPDEGQEQSQVAEAPLNEIVGMLSRSLKALAPDESESSAVRFVMRSGHPDHARAEETDLLDGEGSENRDPTRRLSRPIISQREAFPSDAPTQPIDALPTPARIPAIRGVRIIAPTVSSVPPGGTLASSDGPGATAARRRLRRLAFVVVALLALAWPAYHLLSSKADNPTHSGAR